MDTSDLTLEGLIHDLNNVFQTIRESAELLAADPKWKKVAGTLTRGVNRGQRIAGSIVETSRPPAEVGAVAAAAVEAATDYLDCLRAKPAAFDLAIEPGFRLPGDPAAWERVLVNLILNAAQAGATRVTIRAQSGRIDIEDNGAGIDPQVLSRLFEPRVSTKSSRSGLGLSIVRSIVTRHGATVTARNRQRGAVFTIQLPAGNPA